MITEAQWKRWKDNSTTDDRLNTYVLSDIRQMLGEIDRMSTALRSIESAPASMVNDSESLRHTIRAIQHEARAALRSMPLQDHAVTQDKRHD